MTPVPAPVLEAMRERIEHRGDNILVLRASDTLGVMLTRETNGRLIVSLPDGHGTSPFNTVNVLLDSEQRQAAEAFLRDHGNEGGDGA